MTIFQTINADLQAALARDPAARGPLDVILSYPGFQAITAHRFIHVLHGARIPLLPRWLSNVNRFFTGIEIHPAAQIAPGLFIDHGMGVVIGETAVVGRNCTIYQGVTLGGTSLSHGKRHPTLGDNVTIGVNAAVLGAISVGDNAKVGGGSVVVKDVPPNSTVVGVPARVVMQDGVPVRLVPEKPQVDMPDPTADSIARLQHRVAELEERLNEIDEEAASASTWSWVV